MSPVHTAIIIVHYGAVETTIRCLQSLTTLAQNNLVIISNNSSKDAAVKLMQYAQKKLEQKCLLLNKNQNLEGNGIKAVSDASIVIIQNKTNMGFAAGCNVGIEFALEQKDIKYIWLLNNDTRPESKALDAFIKKSESTPYAILGSTVLFSGRSTLQLAGGVAYSPFTTCIAPAHANASLDDVATLPDPRLDYIYGASFFAPASLFSDVGMFDENFFLFYEELDICTRAKKMGYSLGWCRDSVVLHEVSSSIGKRETASRKQKRVTAFHEARSTILFTCKHYSHLLPLALLARLFAKPLILSYHKDFCIVSHALMGVWDGLKQALSTDSIACNK